MYHSLKYKIVYCLIIVLGILYIPIKANSVTYIGLSHRALISHDGRYIAIIVENRHVKGSEFSIHLWTFSPLDPEGGYFANKYALTPRYKEIVTSPDNKIIAFVEHNMVTDYGIHFYFPENDKIKPSWHYSQSKVEHFQFSKDQKAFRFSINFHNKLDSLKENIGASLRGPIWIIKDMETLKMAEQKNGQVEWTKQGSDTFTEWTPIEKPEVVPQFLKQPMPKITLETQDKMQWSPNSKYLYLFDESGLWRCEVGNYYRPRWTKLVNEPDIIRFEVSPTNNYIVYETVCKDPSERISRYSDPHGLEGIIYRIDIESLNSKINESLLKRSDKVSWMMDTTHLISPEKIASGWGVSFHPGGNILLFSNISGTQKLFLDTMETKSYQRTGIRPD